MQEQGGSALVMDEPDVAGTNVHAPGNAKKGAKGNKKKK
jgi:hypothetical protein